MRKTLATLIGAAAIATAGCGTISDYNPFSRQNSEEYLRTVLDNRNLEIKTNNNATVWEIKQTTRRPWAFDTVEVYELTSAGLKPGEKFNPKKIAPTLEIHSYDVNSQDKFNCVDGVEATVCDEKERQARNIVESSAQDIMIYLTGNASSDYRSAPQNPTSNTTTAPSTTTTPNMQQRPNQQPAVATPQVAQPQTPIQAIPAEPIAQPIPQTITDISVASAPYTGAFNFAVRKGDTDKGCENFVYERVNKCDTGYDCLVRVDKNNQSMIVAKLNWKSPAIIYFMGLRDSSPVLTEVQTINLETSGRKRFRTVRNDLYRAFDSCDFPTRVGKLNPTASTPTPENALDMNRILDVIANKR